MKLYLVTDSDSYYPQDGTADWLFITDDEAAARTYFDQRPHNEYGHIYLIELSADGWKELAEKPV